MGELTRREVVCAKAPSGDVPDALSEALLTRLRTGELELPMLPDVATQVLALARSPDASGAKLAEILQRDQTLAGNVLRLANSPAYGARTQIVSLQQAISRLGLTTLRDMVVSIALRGRVFRAGADAELVRPMWTHALASGCWAKEIARARRSNVESAFLCGLLHDVGYPVILQAIRDIERVCSARYAPAVIMNAMLHYHCVVGGVLVADWKLPEAVSDAIQHHHDYRALPQPPEAAMVTHLADRLAEWMVAGDDAMRTAITESPVIDDLDIYPDDLEQLFALRDKTAQVVADMDA